MTQFMYLRIAEKAFIRFWYKGKTVADMDIMGDIEIINSPESIWWIKIKNNKGQIGWTNQSNDFGNQDACG